MKSLTLILLISLILISSIEATVKTINFKGLKSHQCETDKYAMEFSIITVGFTQDEKINIRLTYPKYIDVECTIPATDDSATNGQIMRCELNTATYPIKSGHLDFPLTLTLPDINVNDWQKPDINNEECHPTPDLTFSPSLEEPEYSCKDHYFTIKGTSSNPNIKESATNGNILL